VTPSGNTIVVFQANNTIHGYVFDPAGTSIGATGAIGTGSNGFDVAAQLDDSFVVVWSQGGDVVGQRYTSDATADGVQMVIADTAATETWPALDTFTNGRFVVVWQSDADGDQDLLARVFKNDGLPASPMTVAVNTSDDGDEIRPDVEIFEPNGGGDFLVVWEGADSDGRGIDGQYFTKSGAKVGTEVVINVNKGGNQTDPRLTVLDTEEAIVVWRGASGHIWARKFDVDGEALTDAEENVLNEDLDGEQSSPDAATQAGGFVLVWESVIGGVDLDIRARLFGSDGAPLAGEFTVNDTTESWQTAPVVDTDSTGNFVVAWESLDQDGDAEGIFFQRFSAGGTAIGDETQANQVTDFEQYKPAIAMDRNQGSDGFFILAWTSFEQTPGSQYDIVARCYSNTGTPVGPEFVVNTQTANNQQSPAVAVLPLGPSRYIVVWESKNEDGDNWGVYAQRLSSTCQKQGEPFLVNTTTTNIQSEPAVAARNDGAFVITWRSLAQDGSNFGIYAQRYDNGGNPVGDEIPVNAITANEQSTPTVSFLPDGSLVFGWKTLGEDEDGAAIKYVRFGNDFEPSGLEYLGNIFNAGHQDQPVVVPMPGEMYGIIWRSEDQDGDAGGLIGRFIQ